MYVIRLILLIINFYILSTLPFSKTQSTGKGWTIYGSKNCGWTVKQLQHMKDNQIDHKFIDCDKDDCKGVDGFPTLKHDDGRVIVGFSNSI